MLRRKARKEGFTYPKILREDSRVTEAGTAILACNQGTVACVVLPRRGSDGTKARAGRVTLNAPAITYRSATKSATAPTKVHAQAKSQNSNDDRTKPDKNEDMARFVTTYGKVSPQIGHVPLSFVLARDAISGEVLGALPAGTIAALWDKPDLEMLRTQATIYMKWHEAPREMGFVECPDGCRMFPVVGDGTAFFPVCMHLDAKNQMHIMSLGRTTDQSTSQEIVALYHRKCELWARKAMSK